MRWKGFLMLFQLSIFLVLFSKVAGQGVFELQLHHFSNVLGQDEQGQCCSGVKMANGTCTGKCNTKFWVCLKHYQASIEPHPPCTFGEEWTPVLGGNSIKFQDGAHNNFSVIRFSFDFSWTGTFSLILEARHENKDSSTVGGDSLIVRRAIQDILEVGEKWSYEEYDTDRVSLRYSYRVLCRKHYYGQSCTKICKPRDDQFGHYTCSELGDKVCIAGWKGDYCDEAECLPGCDKEHGHCLQPNECLCRLGWEGALCDQCLRYPGCVHGTCNKSWDCICKEGWGGLFCNQDLNYCTNHKPCKNGGICRNTGASLYTCECPEGWTGSECEVELDDCANQPCLNGGECSDTGSNYTCSCPRGWHGRHCENKAESCEDRPCQNGATCENIEEHYQCHCPPGFHGVNCERPEHHCDPTPCHNGGKCVEEVDGYRCVCLTGFAGSRCEVNINDCNSNPCLNGGKCLDLANSFKCQCKPGFVGPLCQDNVNDCQMQPCANGGTCIDDVNSFKCRCRAGFAGIDCSVDIDECASAPCRNGGTCVDQVNEYSCRCQPGYTGAQCEFTNGSYAGPVVSTVLDPDQDRLTSSQMALIATFSVLVPIFACVSVCVITVMKQKRRKEKEKADEEARKQNEQNAVHSMNTLNTMNNKCLDTSIIVNDLDYPSSKRKNSMLDIDYLAKEDALLQRTKQLNTNRTSLLSEKNERDYESMCPSHRSTLDKLTCSSSDVSKDLYCSSSGVYVVGDHYPEGTLATEV